MKTKLLLFLSAVILLSACKTGSNFTTRRYTAGHYKPNHSSVKKPETVIAKRNENSLKKEVLEKTYTAADENSVVIASSDSKKPDFVVKKRKKTLDFTKGIEKAKQNKVFNRSLLSVKDLFSKKDKPLKSGKGDSEISTKSLIGFACGIGGIAVDIVCFIAAIAALEYIILLGMLLGLVLGILGIIFGTQGIKDYRSSRNTPTLVFGIVGAATGLAAIILAFYFGIYGAFWIAASTI